MTAIKAYGKISDEGVLTIVNRKTFDADIKEFAGKNVVITVERRKSQRSSQQNRYYYGCVVPIVQQGLKDIGHRLSKEDTHLFLRNRFLTQELVSSEGEVIGNRLRSTTELNKSEFADYTSEIQQFSAEYLNIVIPDPLTQVTISCN